MRSLKTILMGFLAGLALGALAALLAQAQFSSTGFEHAIGYDLEITVDNATTPSFSLSSPANTSTAGTVLVGLDQLVTLQVDLPGWGSIQSGSAGSYIVPQATVTTTETYVTTTTVTYTTTLPSGEVRVVTEVQTVTVTGGSGIDARRLLLPAGILALLLLLALARRG